VNPKAIEAMKELGYDLTTHQSKGLDDYDGQHFDAAVTMGCGDECPLVIATNRVDWQIPDPRDMASRTIPRSARPDRSQGKGTLGAMGERGV
jgi:protein-tyrosine-phosphatase